MKAKRAAGIRGLLAFVLECGNTMGQRGFRRRDERCVRLSAGNARRAVTLVQS